MAQGSESFLKEALTASKSAFWYAAVFSLAMNILMLALPLYSLQVYDRVMSSGSMETLLMLSILAFGAFIFLALFSALRTFILQHVNDWLDRRIAPKIFAANVIRSALLTDSAGSQSMRDLANIKAFITGPGCAALFDAPWSVVYFVIIYLIHPALGVVSVLGGLLLFCIAVFTELATKKPIESASKHNIKGLSFVEAANRNAEVVEAMGLMRSVLHYWEKMNGETMRHQEVASHRSALIAAFSKFARMLIQILVIGVGGYYSLHHEITSGGLIAASILSGRALGPFEAAIQGWKSFVSARESWHRLNVTLSKIPLLRGTMNMPMPKGVLVAENVVYKPFNTDKLILRGISFKLNGGESLGLIGPSAAGKSTLAKLIVGIWQPTQGAVRLDGVDVYKWSREDFGKYVGFLPQDVELFPTSIRNNIARLDPTATDEEVVEAAQMAGVHEMILRLPQGYETEIGMGVSTLSPGQKQRIGLAVALFRKPKLLVLDEPNSNLDGEGEAALGRALLQAKELGMTTIMVAHKPSLVVHVDKVLMLRSGTVEAFGPREEILKRYARPMAVSPQGSTPAIAEQRGA